MSSRDYNKECKDNEVRKYAYRFDYEVMHPFVLRTIAPFFRAGKALELGSFQGDFTERILGHFDEITCVDASSDALRIARSRLPKKINFVHGRFEDLVLPCRFDNILMIHVLEHADNPVEILKRVNTEWVTDDGRFFLVCPNANAPSRQIAVKMGLITHNSAVTAAEAAHGHRITYSLDTLERDARASGFSVLYRAGVFFKALANFQWDRILATDIVSDEYLKGCYELGQLYPELCSSIVLVCEKGK